MGTNPMFIKAIILIGVALSNLVFALVLYFRNRKNWIHIFYAISVFMTAMWALFTGIFYLTSSQVLASISIHLMYIAAALIAPAFFAFAYVFPYRRYEFPEKLKKIIFISIIGIMIISAAPNVLVKAYINPAGQGNDVSLNFFWNIIYTIYFLTLFGWAFVELFLKMKMGGVIKLQLKHVLRGTVIAGLFGVIFNLIFPFWTTHWMWLGPYFTLFMIIYVTYFIFFFDPDKKKRY